MGCWRMEATVVLIYLRDNYFRTRHHTQQWYSTLLSYSAPQLSFPYCDVLLAAGHGSCSNIRATVSHGRMISDSRPERLLVRPPIEENKGPALSSSHCKHSFSSQAGGGPLLGAVSEPMQVRPHALPS